MIGAGSAAVAAALPVVAIALPVAPPVAKIMPLPPPKYLGPYLHLHPSQWRFFESSGFNMDLCKLIEPIPVSSKGDIYVRR